MPKYTVDNLIPMFIKAAALRNEMCDLGFTDNGGAIHSAERILDILGQRLKYPGLSHINNYKNYENAEFSVKALKAHKRGEKVLIEHVAPRRDFTCQAIDLLKKHSGDHTDFADELKRFVKKHYRLVLLTPDETTHLNQLNRSKMKEGRLDEAGIVIAP